MIVFFLIFLIEMLKYTKKINETDTFNKKSFSVDVVYKNIKYEKLFIIIENVKSFLSNFIKKYNNFKLRPKYIWRFVK